MVEMLYSSNYLRMDSYPWLVNHISKEDIHVSYFLFSSSNRTPIQMRKNYWRLPKNWRKTATVTSMTYIL